MKRTLFPDTARTVYSYEDNGRRIVQKSYDAEGNFYFKQVQEYEDGYLTEIKSYSSTHSDLDQENQLILNNHHAYRYNEKGKRTEERSFNSDGTVYSIFSFYYDRHGNVAKKKYEYENKNRNRLDENSYKYDGHYNWIRKVEFVNGSPYMITEREIEFYK